MDVNFHQVGTVAWVELNTPDIDASTRFYGQLFGWAFAEGFGGQPQSRTALLGGRPAAAVTAAPGARQGSWTMFVAVANAGHSLERVVALGGKVLVHPHALGAAGRSAVVADHAGTRFGLWEAGEHQGFGVMGEPGAFHGGELITDDVEESVAFYGEVFGWTPGEPYGPLNRRDWRLGDRSISVLLPRPPAMQAEIPPYWDACFTVADAQQTADAAVRLGATVLMSATAIGHGVIAVLLDPTGAVFTVLAPTD